MNLQVKGQVSAATRISSIKPKPNYSQAWEVLILGMGSRDVMAGLRLTDRVGGMRGMPSTPGALMAVLPVCSLAFSGFKARIKGHRKLPELILDRHVDGLGRPHQHLHQNGTAAVTGQAIQGSGNTYGWVMVRAVRGLACEHVVR